MKYGADGTPHGLAYAGQGESCQRLIRENRECVTVHPFVSFEEEIAVPHHIQGKRYQCPHGPKSSS